MVRIVRKLLQNVVLKVNMCTVSLINCDSQKLNVGKWYLCHAYIFVGPIISNLIFLYVDIEMASFDVFSRFSALVFIFKLQKNNSQ